MSKLSEFLHRASGGVIPEINLIPHADDLAKTVANEILDRYRQPVLAALDEAATDLQHTLITGEAALRDTVTGYIKSIPGIPASIAALAEHYIEDADLSDAEDAITAKLTALIADVREKVAGARF